jgi:hypothetical protein
MYSPYVVIPGTFKPPLGYRVNLSHPLGRNCAFCIPFCNAGEAYDTRRGRLDTQFYNVPKYVIPGTQSGSLTTSNVSSKWGPGVANTNAVSGFSISATDLFPTQSMTIALIRRCRDTAQRSGIHIGAAGAGNGGYVYFSGNGGGASGSVLIFGGTGSPPGAGANRLDVTYNKTTNPEMWVARAGRLGLSIWKDSIRLGNQTTPISRTTLGTDTMLCGDGNFCIGSDNVEYYFVLVINDEWSDDQIRWWFATPFAMMYPAYDQLSSVPLVGMQATAATAAPPPPLASARFRRVIRRRYV